MFTTRQSRENLFSVLQSLFVLGVFAFNVFVTFFTNWVDSESAAGVFAGMAVVVVWIATLVAYGSLLYFLYDQKYYKLFSSGLIVGMAIGPVMTLLGAWSSNGTFASVITDGLMVIGWVFTIVMIAVLIFNPFDFIYKWIQSGDDAESAKQKKRAAREAKKAAAEAEKTRKRNLASNGEPIDLSLADDPDAHLSEYTATSESGSPSTS